VTEADGRDELSRRRVAAGENRLPPALAVVVAIVIYSSLPGSVLFSYRVAIPAVEVLLLGALIATNPRRMTRESRWSRWVSVALATVVIATNMGSLGLLIQTLTERSPGGTALLVAGMQVWATNVIGFALLYWELDRGGPVARRRLRRAELPDADWRFSQDENDDAVAEVRRTSSESSEWVPIFVDYLYLSVTNSSAFSPTDTMPLTSRAKVLMALQASAALLTSLLVIARAVGSLGG
jgi:hypothetical protein